jgi:small subunit ribosomal protein S16
MAVSLRLRRMGRTKRPVFAVVASDSRSPRDGRFIEDLGRYEPISEPAHVSLKEDRILYWLQNGAQPSDTVRSLLSKQGVMLRLHMLRKGKSADEIEQAIESWREERAGAAPARKLTPADRRREAIQAERKQAEEDRKRQEGERREREQELARQKAESDAQARAEAEARREAEQASAAAEGAESAPENAELAQTGDETVTAENASKIEVQAGVENVDAEEADVPESAPAAAAEQMVVEEGKVTTAEAEENVSEQMADQTEEGAAEGRPDAEGAEERGTT